MENVRSVKPALPARLLHGGDYNPDQWLDCPEVLEEDIALMKKAHVNCVSLGIFAWSRLEPEEGRFDFDWLEKIMDNLYQNGIYTILATPTGAMPHWLTDTYEEVNKVDSSGKRRIHGQRHNFCPSSPVMRERTRAIDTALSLRFGHHPGLLAWHLSNEYGGDGGASDCHCPYCQANFRKWLQNRYGTLDNLNHAWWSGFWSNIVTDWEQIHSPVPYGEMTLHGLKLDWKRFTSDQMMDYCKAEAEAVRTYSDAPVTINMMGPFDPLNYFRWAKELDIVSEDSYPFWHTQEDPLDPAVMAAFRYSLIRSLKKQPFLLMESVTSAVNWHPRCTLKRPGMHELSSLQAVAHGSNSVQYFQWRKSRGGSEKFHGAVVDHRNGENTRVFREVTHLGERLETLSDKVMKTCNRPRAAIVFDWENRWAAEDAQAIINPLDFLEKWMPWFRPFWEQGVDVDIVDMDSSLEDYSLVVAPLNYMYRGDYAQRVRTFVETGGTYVTSYWSGEVDENDLCFLGHHPLSDVLGIRTEDIDVRPVNTENEVVWGQKRYPVMDLCAIVHPEGAQVLAQYANDFYAGFPALTRHSFGKGTAYFAAAECGGDFLRDLVSLVTGQTGNTCALKAVLPYGVTVTERKGGEGSLFFLQNFNPEPTAVTLEKAYLDAETGENLSGPVTLAPYECRILENGKEV